MEEHDSQGVNNIRRVSWFSLTFNYITNSKCVNEVITEVTINYQRFNKKLTVSKLINI